jgi:hypothetical protein
MHISSDFPHVRTAMTRLVEGDFTGAENVDTAFFVNGATFFKNIEMKTMQIGSLAKNMLLKHLKMVGAE